MRDEVLSQFTGGQWLAAAMIVFLVVFMVFTLWTYRKSAKKFYRRMARMPLDGGKQNDEKRV
jgi:cbb3-type cytochrome oxidase subunit 3